MPTITTFGAAAARGFGLTARGFFKFTKTISASTSNYDLKADAIANGWNEVLPLDAYVTINSGVTISSTSTSTPAFTTGSSYPSGSRLTLINNGIIVGRGGAGGSAKGPFVPEPGGSTPGNPGSAGGNAFTTTIKVSLTNNNRIAGGGGGGAGGTTISYPGGGSGGGGGGGGIGVAPRGNGLNGFGGGADRNGTPGTAGTLTAAGPGGAGASGTGPNGPGGPAGSYGAAGTSRGSAAGGAAGSAIVGDSLVTRVVAGNINGPVSG